MTSDGSSARREAVSIPGLADALKRHACAGTSPETRGGCHRSPLDYSGRSLFLSVLLANGQIFEAAVESEHIITSVNTGVLSCPAPPIAGLTTIGDLCSRAAALQEGGLSWGGEPLLGQREALVILE